VQLTARRCNRVEIWDKPQCAGGVRLAVLPEYDECTADTQLTGTTELTLACAINAPGAVELLEQRVLRIWEDDTHFDEWRISVRKQIADSEVRITGAALETFIGLRPSPIGQVNAGVRAYNLDVVGLKPSEIFDQYILPSLTADGIAWLARGAIDQDTPIDLTLDWDSPLAALKKIADGLKLEIQFRRNAVAGYYVDFLTKIGAAAATVDVRYEKNLRDHQLDRTTDEQANRVFPRGGSESGVRATIARARWLVNNVAGNVVTLADPLAGDGPIAFNNQLNGLYLRKVDGTLTLITASSAGAQTVTVASAAGVAALDLIEFRANVGGDDLTWLDSPADQTTYGVVVGHPDFADVPGTNNVIPNPAGRTWPAGTLPTGYTNIGGGTPSKNVAAPFFRTVNAQSIKYIAAAANQGVRTPAGKIFPTDTKPYGSGYASLWIASGKVRCELVLTTGAGTKILPVAPAIASSALLGQWLDLGVSGENFKSLGVTDVAVQVLSDGGAATFYIDRAQATNTDAQLPFFEGSGGTRLWQLGNEALLLRAAPPAAFTIAIADLARLDPNDANAIPELGAAVNVTDARVNGGTVGSRIAGVRINYLALADTTLLISNRLEDLTGALERPTRVVRLEPVVLQPGDDLGPALDVIAVPGSTAYTINYSVTADVFEYSTNGAAYTSVPASGFSVSRPAAGANDTTLTFRATRNGQIATDTVVVTAIDKDTVTPDLSVTQTAQTSTTTSFQATAANPGGGAAPTLTVEFVNCTGVGYVGGGPFTIASGTVVQVNRPAFATNQSSVKFKAAIASAGTEEISRTVLCQDGFGPLLDVTAVPGSTSYTINYAVTATTFEYSIDGAAYIAVPATGFSVSRPSAGSNDKTLTFRAIKDSQTICDTVIVTAVDKDTATPDISVAQTAQTSTTTSFQVTGSNPGGGGAPTITVEFVNCTGVGYVGGGPHTIASGTTVQVNRPAYAAAQATVKFRGSISGGGAEEIQRTVPAQDGFGPSLDVTAVPGSTSYTINYTVTATTFEYAIDGGSFAAVPATGFTVSRNAIGGAAKTLVFRAIKDSQTVTSEITVPAQVLSTSLSLSLSAGVASNNGAAPPPYNQLDMSWSVTDMPTGTTYNVGYDNGSGNVDSDTGISATSKTFTGVTFAGTPGKGAMFVDAILNGSVIATARRNKVYIV
jgi:hypothetical protein